MSKFSEIVSQMQNINAVPSKDGKHIYILTRLYKEVQLSILGTELISDETDIHREEKIVKVD